MIASLLVRLLRLKGVCAMAAPVSSLPLSQLMRLSCWLPALLKLLLRDNWGLVGVPLIVCRIRGVLGMLLVGQFSAHC